MPPQDIERASAVAEPRLDASFDTLWDELVWRGLVHVSTDQDELRVLLAGPPISCYCGFDPTAPSLHLGNLVQLLTLRRIQLGGHRPYGLVGGSTGLIGDPKPTAERTLNTKETVAEWVDRLRRQIGGLLDFEGEYAATLVNNLDWTAPLSAIDFLRDVGKHFRVGTMLKKDAVAARLNSDAGISYTEFSYQLLQALDFLELYRSHGVVLQTGGSDQWGNLTAGVDLVRRVEGATVHALGTPLITNSDGTKFGKSEGNAVWLDPELMSPYGFYQFWLNSADADVIERLKIFTFLSRAEIEALAEQVEREPFRRTAQQRLALEVTAYVHGLSAAEAVVAASAALFGSGDLRELDQAVLADATAELPSAHLAPEGTVAEALAATGLCSSLSDARRAVAQGGVSLDNRQVADADAPLASLADGRRLLVLRRGKKTLARVELR